MEAPPARAVRDPREPEVIEDAVPVRPQHPAPVDEEPPVTGDRPVTDAQPAADERPATGDRPPTQDTPGVEAPTPDPTPTPPPTPTPTFTTAAASTPSAEAVSELRSEAGSETPSKLPSRPLPQASAANSANSAGNGPRRGGISLARAQAVTEEHRPGLGPHPLSMPPGELPGPALPSTHRRARRRALLLAAIGVVTAGAVVAIVLAANSGSSGDNQAGPSTSASSAPSNTPSATPSPTVEGTARPPSIPPGAHQEAGGFAWATPTGWRRDVKTGSEIHYTSPNGKQELVAKSTLARGNLMESWRTSERNARDGKDYQLIRLEETKFRGNPAVVWEYTFTLNNVAWHAQLLGFDAHGKSYQVNTWYQPDIEAQALKTYGKVKDSFTVM